MCLLLSALEQFFCMKKHILFFIVRHGRKQSLETALFFFHYIILCKHCAIILHFIFPL
nr:MAG TPA: hypothetical protein [Caudoviricetes sp.]